MTARNREVRADHRIIFRMGINLGDVIIEEDDIFGDGVNVAARLETLAEPGGICISRMVRDQVRGKLDITFVDQGDRQLKNIARPVRAFRIWLADDPPPKPTPLPPGKPSAVVPPPQAVPDTTRKSDQPYFLLLFQKISKLRALSATIVLLAGSASVASLSVDTHLKFRGPNFFGGASQSSEGRSEGPSPGPVKPNLPISQPVDNRLVADLATPSNVIGDPVFFEKDKVVLPASANSIIDHQAEFLRDNPTITATVEGYCSEDEGMREGPVVLAQLRANQLRNALKERGVAGTRIQALGYGRLRSAAAGADEVSRPQDRRAVVIRD
jgi:outer membrane protein OmpA-like peptidoglycan-associated protein